MNKVWELLHEPLTDGLCFGDTPRYRNGKLYVSDMTGCKIYAIDVASGAKDVLVDVEAQAGGMAFLDEDTLIYSSMFDAKLHRYSLKDQSVNLYADMSHVMKGYSGDMVIDRAGRVYLDDTGARVMHGERPWPGRVLRIDSDRVVNVVAENIILPNALLISSDGKTLFSADTFGSGLAAYDISPDGSLSNRQEVWSPETIIKSKLELSESLIGIDGGCMDAEGGIWLGLFGLGEFVRLSPNKQVTHRIKTGGLATACALGGKDGKTLFLVTNWVPESEELYTAMATCKTRCTVSTAQVEVGRGMALP